MNPGDALMRNTRVYDWPTRIFHWLFAATFAGAFFIGKTFDDDSPNFPYHMLLGMTLVAGVVFRIIWGFTGSRYARFGSFILKPSAALTYFKHVLSGKGPRFPGHNPASSWAALVMMALGLGLGATGYLMTSGGNKELFEELHELLGNLLLVTAIVHIAGVSLHTLVHRELIGLSMVHGRKKSVEGQHGIARSHWVAGLMFLALVGGFALHLVKSYDPTHRTLNLFGTTLNLGESGEHEHD